MTLSALTEIRVAGFKSIREMELKLSNLNVLIGLNGAGKSNFIQVFVLLHQIAEENLQLYVAQSGGADALLRFGQKSTDRMIIDVKFGLNYYLTELAPAGDALIFGLERCGYRSTDIDTWREIELGRGHQETRLNQEAQGYSIPSYVVNGLKSWKVYHFHDTSASAKVKLTGDIENGHPLKADAANLAAFLYNLRQRDAGQYAAIVKTIQLAAPFFRDFYLTPNPANPATIQLKWKEATWLEPFGAHLLSDGTLRFMCLTALLMQPVLPSIILIDEPELGLHPSAIHLLAEMIKSAATKTQVIVSTQSVPLVNQFTPDDLIVVDRNAEQSTFRRLAAGEVEGWLDEYGMGDLWEKNLIGGRP